MNIELKEFQQEAVDDLAGKVRFATEGAVKVGLQAVVLSAPTGSGKTVMATALIERILSGDDTADPDPEATFLWVTDLPELNEQTLDKMEATSDVLNLFNLRVVGSTFDKRVFDPGKVHFLNTQKLGKDKLLTQKGDGRTYSIWETIQNTVDEPGATFYLIIDEAHRGMRSKRDDKVAASIIQRFLKGSEAIDPVPVVIGISATPARFDALLEGQGRTTHRTEVDVARVRESGLIKDTLVLYNPEDDQRADMTLLGEAAKHWQVLTNRWADYCDAEMIEPVTPILVVQVENAPAGATGTRTPLDTAIATINSVLSTPLPPDAFAHSFDENSAIDVKSTTIRYLAPSKIATDRNVRAVFFKTALSTGWYCPQAETMMSFRKAADATYIAQLIGRMVRTPLARRIYADETLNSVALFLPHYDARGIEKVVNTLQDPDYEYVPPVEIELGPESVTLQRVDGSDALFEALAKVPNYIVPSNRKTKQTRRLMRMARALVRDGIDSDAIDMAHNRVVETLDTAMAKAAITEAFSDKVVEKSLIRYAERVFDMRTGELTKGNLKEAETSPVNINHLFGEAGRRAGEGLHRVYWQHRTAGLDAVDEIRLEKIKVAVLLSDPNVVILLETFAAEQVDHWHKKYIDTIEQLSEERSDVYDEILGGASDPVATKLQIGKRLLWRRPKDAKAYEKHIFVDSAGKFFEKFKSSWESDLLAEEVPRTELVGWYRNRDRQRTSFRVPYQRKGRWHTLYPDFIFLRKVDDRIVVDVLDPHDPTRADAVPKAKGLARYAEKHGARFGRVRVQAKIGDQLKSLELTDPKVREAVNVLDSSEALVHLYETAGV